MTQTQILSLSEIIPVRAHHSDHRPQEDLFATKATKINRRYECTWLNDTGSQHSLPNVIVPVESDLESLFADVATYHPEYSPITAYAYAIDRPILPLFEKLIDSGSSVSSSSNVTNDRRRRIQISLIVAEILSILWMARRDENDLSYARCRNSFGFCLARCGALYPTFENDLVKSKWIELRELTETETLGSLLTPIAWIFDTLEGNRSTLEKLTNIDATIQDLVSGKIHIPEFVNALDGLYPGISRLREGLTGHFDGRVSAFEKITNTIIEARRDRETEAMAIAFFANLIQPGSFTHTRLLSRRSDQYPSVLIWYGLFAAVSAEFDYHRGFAGLGSKLARDIESVFNLANRPGADLSLDELRVLSRLGFNPGSIKPTQNHFMLVSLIPGVDVYARFPISEREINKDQISRMLEAVSNRDRNLKRLLQQALSLLNSIKETELAPSRVQKPSRKDRM